MQPEVGLQTEALDATALAIQTFVAGPERSGDYEGVERGGQIGQVMQMGRHRQAGLFAQPIDPHRAQALLSARIARRNAASAHVLACSPWPRLR